MAVAGEDCCRQKVGEGVEERLVRVGGCHKSEVEEEGREQQDEGEGE